MCEIRGSYVISPINTAQNGVAHVFGSESFIPGANKSQGQLTTCKGYWSKDIQSGGENTLGGSTSKVIDFAYCIRIPGEVFKKRLITENNVMRSSLKVIELKDHESAMKG